MNKEKENIRDNILFQYYDNDYNKEKKENTEQALACSEKPCDNTEDVKTNRVGHPFSY